MATPKRHFAIRDIEALRKNAAAAKGLEKRSIDLLYACLKPDANRNKRDNYDLHWVMVYLLEQSDESKAKAKQAVWTEAIEGGPIDRSGHSWDQDNFFKQHIWIASAMAAHIAIAADWLAAEGVFDSKEMNAIGEKMVSAFWTYIYPHLKGRGRSPIYVEPMNQDAAMVAGCLMIGYLFGTKWMTLPKAQRLYADARVLAGNLLGQFFKTGFDNDGFTYMRIIQPPVLTLLALVLEEAEGVDFYHQRFAPNNFSVAMFMEKLQRFVLPSGTSFPYGRYGYVLEWNVYSQAYAAHKTGNPAYLEQCLSTKQAHYITPWIAMDLPLAVALSPYGSEAGTPRKIHKPVYETWHDPDIWSNIASAKAKLHAHLCWRKNSHATMVLEHEGERCVVLSGESSSECNSLTFNFVNSKNEAGSQFEHLMILGVQVSRIQLKNQWDPRIIKDFTKTVLVLDQGLVLTLDQFLAYCELDTTYQLNTMNPIEGEMMPSEKTGKKIQILTNLGAWNREKSEKATGKHSLGVMNRAKLPRDYKGFAAALFNFSEKKVSHFKTENNSVQWQFEGMNCGVHLNLDQAPRFRTEKWGQTDGLMLVNLGEGLILFSARYWRRDKDWLWSTARVNLGWIDQTLSVETMKYGQYIRFRCRLFDVSILRGTGYDVYIKSDKNVILDLPLPGDMTFVQVNGKVHSSEKKENRLYISYKAKAGQADLEKSEIKGTKKGLKKENLKNAIEMRDTPANVNTFYADMEKSFKLSQCDDILVNHHEKRLDEVRDLLQSDDTYVRLMAAEVLGWIGEDSDAVTLIERMIAESGLSSEIGGISGPWFGKWQFFSAVTVMADSLRKLGNSAVLPQLERAYAMQVEPHAKESIQLAISTLREGA